MRNRADISVPIIVGCVAAAIVLMLWALYETNGPSSLDVSKKPPQTTGSSPSGR